MGRSTESSYKVIARYLEERKLPATLNDMVDANIISRSTLYNLLRPELFGEAALFGIVPLNNKKPFFFSYDPEAPVRMLSKVDGKSAEIVSNHTEVLKSAANKVAANAIVLDNIERKILSCVKKHRAAEDMKEKDATLLDNFTRLSGPEQFLHQVDMPEVREIFLSDISKFRTFLISAYVASFNED